MTGEMISKLLLMAMLCVVVFVLTMAIRPAPAGETPVYDKDGRYSGSVFDYGKTQTYTDRSGQFTGSAVKERHHVVLQPEWPVLRLSWFVDRPDRQLQQEVMKTYHGLRTGGETSRGKRT
jgi:hypothetical protein